MADSPTPSEPDAPGDLRLSDAERAKIADYLRDQATEGRLTLVELEDRLDLVYSARVRADLVPITEGLPVPQVAAAPTPGSPPRVASTPRLTRSTTFDRHLQSYLIIIGFLVAIYAVTDLGGYFWPIWPAMGWGVALAFHRMSCQSSG